MKRILIVCWGLLTIPAQAQLYLLKADSLHVGNGDVVSPAYFYFSPDSIVAVSSREIPVLHPDSVIEYKEAHVYPSFIAMSTLLGMVEIGAVRATRDYDEVGTITPNVRPIVAFNTDSRILPTTVSNGILVAQLRPAGGILPGKTSVAYLKGRTWEEAAIAAEYGLYLSWPRRYYRDGRKNKQWKQQIDRLYSFFREAQAYVEAPHAVERNLRYEALREVFQNKAPVFIEADHAADIMAAFRFVDRFGLRMVLVGGRGVWPVLDEIRRRGIPLVLQTPHSLPLHPDDPVDAWYRMPARLAREGIPFALAINKVWDGVWQQRNLPFVAATAIGYGLDPEKALEAISAMPARILGLADRLGTLEVGKEATFIISRGSAFDIPSHRIEAAFIRGRRISVDDPHKQLYRRYSRQYGIPAP